MMDIEGGAVIASKDFHNEGEGPSDVMDSMWNHPEQPWPQSSARCAFSSCFPCCICPGGALSTSYAYCSGLSPSHFGAGE